MCTAITNAAPHCVSGVTGPAHCPRISAAVSAPLPESVMARS